TIQLMTSLIIQSLGYFWKYLFFSQSAAFAPSSGYIPVTGASGYSLWASLFSIRKLFNSITEEAFKFHADLDYDNEHLKHLHNISRCVFNSTRTDDYFKYRIVFVAT
ncbi:hypothetical protein A6R68_10130, partial [Neotoma lepida]